MNTPINWWNSTRVITWATTSNVCSFLAWHSRKGKVGTLIGCGVVKWFGVPLGFTLFFTVGVVCLYTTLWFWYFSSCTWIICFVRVCCAFDETFFLFFQARRDYSLSFLNDWHYNLKCICHHTWYWCWKRAGIFYMDYLMVLINEILRAYWLEVHWDILMVKWLALIKSSIWDLLMVKCLSL